MGHCFVCWGDKKVQLADHRKQKTVLECAVHPRVPEQGDRKQSIYKLGIQYYFLFIYLFFKLAMLCM